MIIEYEEFINLVKYATAAVAGCVDAVPKVTRNIY